MIKSDIARLERNIIVAKEEKAVHEEDLQFHLELLDELGGFESKDEEEASIEVMEGGENKIYLEQQKNATEITGATETPRKSTRAEIQEATEKAKAWQLD